MVTFPSNPALNQVYPPDGQPAIDGRRWKFNGTAWAVVPSVGWNSLTGVPSSFAPAQHSHDIADVAGLQTALDGKQASGTYATLDLTGKIPASQLPSFVDDVVEVADLTALNALTGETSKIYVNLDTGKIYRWSGSVFVEISSSPGSTDSVPEGVNNLYFTPNRAAFAAPVQSVAGKTGNVTLSASDISGLDTAVSGGGKMSANFTVKAVQQGSYNDGSVITKDTPLEDVIKNMLQVRVAAPYYQPSISITTSTGLYPELGTDISATLVTNWNKGSAGNATKFVVKRDGSVVQTTNASAPTNYAASFRLLGNTSFTAEATYEAGAQLYDNLNDPSGTPLPAGTAGSGALTFVPLRKSFYGADTGTSTASSSAQVRSIANQPLGIGNGSSFNISIPAGSTRVTIAYPANLRPLTSVKSAGLGNAEVGDVFMQTTVSVEAANGVMATDYRVYTFRPAVAFGSGDTYIVTV